MIWDFGAVLELAVRNDAQNYLFTRSDVPFHWDGAFASATPSYIVFQCMEAPEDNGGETLFCNTIRVLDGSSEGEKATWRLMTMKYCTEKVAHYGGEMAVPLVSNHPGSGLARLRYAEPLDPSRYLNPLSVEILGQPPDEGTEFFEDMRWRLYQPDVCYEHRWHEGDVVIADNHALLHGRRPLPTRSERRLRRVHIL